MSGGCCWRICCVESVLSVAQPMNRHQPRLPQRSPKTETSPQAGRTVESNVEPDFLQKRDLLVRACRANHEQPVAFGELANNLAYCA